MIGNIPGTDVYRLITFLFISICYFNYFKYACLPSFPVKISMLIIILSGLLASYGFVLGITMEKSEINKLKHILYLYFPKILSTLSGCLFILLICFWVIALDGVLNSPFSPILTFGPLYYIIQLTQMDERNKFNSISDQWYSIVKIKKTNITKYIWKIIRIIEIIALLSILISITIGEYIIYRYDIIWDKDVLFKAKECLNYTVCGYASYYITSFLTAFAVLPQKWRSNISEVIWGVSTNNSIP